MKEFTRQCLREFGEAMSMGLNPTPLVSLQEYALSQYPQFATREMISPVVIAIVTGLQQKCGHGDRLLALLNDLKSALEMMPELKQTHLGSNLSLLCQAVSLLEVAQASEY